MARYKIQECIPVGCVSSAAVTVVGVCVLAGTCLEWGDLPGVYLPGVGGVPAQVGLCTCPRGGCVPDRGGVVYLPGGVPAGKAPAWRVYLPGDV